MTHHTVVSDGREAAVFFISLRWTTCVIINNKCFIAFY